MQQIGLISGLVVDLPATTVHAEEGAWFLGKQSES